MITYPGGWPDDLAERFAAAADDEYEDALKACRLRGHDFEMGYVHDGREFLRCVRCRTRFEEVDDA